MTRRTNVLLVSFGVAMMVALPLRVAAQDSLATARQLYASAEYNSALTMLSALLAANPSPQDRQSIELYRVFCLFAVNSVDEANKALEAMILRDPLYRPSLEDVPRRLRPAIVEARKRLLPTIIEQKYILAKTAFDRRDFEAAGAGFTQTLMALADPDIAQEAQERPLSDLRVLAAGFNELTVRAMAPPPAPQPAAPTPAPEPAVARAPGTIYDSRYAEITPPVVVQQDVPPYRGQIFAQKNGRLDIIIGETGAVESVTMLAPLEPRYTALLMAAAKGWQYKPAMLGGVPVKYKKTIQITLTAPK